MHIIHNGDYPLNYSYKIIWRLVMLFITFQYFSAFMKKGKRYKEKNTQARNSPGKSTEVYYMLTSTLLRFKY